jgi:ubiquinone biosynthesis accessory factor UbiJ
MNTPSPASLLESIASRLQPPAWVVDETQQRLVLFLNHVLMQEKEAQDRLARKKGSVVHVRWGLFGMDLLVTPAGLLDRALPSAKPDLTVSVATESPLTIAQAVMSGRPPPVKIEGDVQFAAELGWLAENLRWDIEEDLSRIVGDIPAHAVADAGRRILSGLKQFLAKSPANPAGAASPVAAAGMTSTPTGGAAPDDAAKASA